MSPRFSISKNASLRPFNTFGIDVTVEKLIALGDLDALEDVLAAHDSPELLLLGAGSNVVLVVPPPAVLRILDDRISVTEGEADTVLVRCAAGKTWHDFVMHTLDNGWFGLENLALIPGTVGASPVQNIGAYGVEIMDRILSVEAWDRHTGMPVTFLHDACDFSYRDSRFKHTPDRYFITHVTFRLSTRPELVLHYAGIRDELQAAGITDPTPRAVAEAVMRQRQRKLPDPAVTGNAGSFFKNPIVDEHFAATLAAQFPDMPFNRSGIAGTRKLSAAWLIEQAGMKGYTRGRAGVSARHALVLVNHGEATGAEVLQVARDVARAVEDKFGVLLHPEPRLVGAQW